MKFPPQDDNEQAQLLRIRFLPLTMSKWTGNSAKLNELLDRSLDQLRRQSFEDRGEHIQFRGWNVPIEGGGVRIFPRQGVKSIGNSPLGLAIRKKQNALAAYRNLSPHIEDIAKGLERFRLNAILDELIEFDSKSQKRNAHIIRGAAGSAAGALIGNAASSFHPDVEVYKIDKALKHEATKANQHITPFFGSGNFGTNERSSRFITEHALRGKKIFRRSVLGGAVLGAAALGSYSPRDRKKELSAMLDSIIAFDDRPRNTMGEFTSSEDRPATNPNNNAKVYKIGGNFSNAAVTGAGGAAGAGSVYGAGKLVKALYEKLRVKK